MAIVVTDFLKRGCMGRFEAVENILLTRTCSSLYPFSEEILRSDLIIDLCRQPIKNQKIQTRNIVGTSGQQILG